MRLGWMVQLQNSPTPLQARPARPKWPQPSLPAVPPSRGLGGAPGPVPPVPQGAQHQPPGLLSPARGVAGPDAADIGGCARRAAAACSAVPAARPAPRWEPGLHKQLRGHRSLEEPVGGRSPWLGRVQGISGRWWKPSWIAVRWTGKESVTTNRCSEAGDTTAGGISAGKHCVFTLA